MQPFLVDVPVKINIWIREECQKRQFEIIKKARPSILFIQSDGGRNEDEWHAIKKNRKMIEEGIDWECKIFRLYEDTNNGMYTMTKRMRELIWNNVDRCIFLEDDQLPSISFFKYCAELLEKYKNDERIECICGMNHLGVSKNVSADYFFSRQGSIWGTATWKRVEIQRGNFEYGKDPYLMRLLRQRTRHNNIAWKRLSKYAVQDNYEGHAPGPEFWIEFEMYSQNRLQIIPKYNMISNIGCTKSSAHSDSIDQLPYGIRRVFNMKTYEITFPLKHANYVIPDIEYEKKRNRIMGYNNTIIKMHRTIELIWLKLKSGNFDYIKTKMIKKLTRKVRSNDRTEE